MKLPTILLVLGIIFYTVKLRAQNIIIPHPNFKTYWINNVVVNVYKDTIIQYSQAITFRDSITAATNHPACLRKMATFRNRIVFSDKFDQRVNSIIKKVNSTVVQPNLHFNTVSNLDQKNIKIAPLNPLITTWTAVDPTTILDTNCGTSIDIRQVRPTLSILFYYTLSGDSKAPITYNLEFVLSANF